MELMAVFPRDHRFKGFFWDNPSIILSVVLLYLWFVLRAGPEWMAARRAYRLNPITRFFNLSQVLANVWFAYTMIDIAIRNHRTGHFSFGCNPPSSEVPPVNNEMDMTLLEAVGSVYFWVRTFDLLDTVFFVLAKKQSHVSFLHVYHHVVVVTTAYIYIRSGWTPSIYYAAIVNSIVHIVMYSYYFLSTFPSLKPYLWWKKYITGLQILQFCILLLQLSWNSIHNCGYPLIVHQYNVAQVSIFLVLFTKFYLERYSQRKKAKC